MAGVNKVILVGNLTADPELRNTDSGTAVCEFRMAVNESWKGKDGESQERVEYSRIVAWAGLGENCNKYLTKGRAVYVEGRLQTRQWEDKEGNKRYTTEIIARDVQFLGSGGGERQSAGGSSEPESKAPPAGDDIPF